MNYLELKHLIPKKSQYWTVSQVIRWLQFIALPKCCPLFETLSIDGKSLKKLTVQDLHHKIGIRSKIICKKLITWITYGLQQFDILIQQNTQSQPSPVQSLQQTQNNDYNPQIPQVCLKKSIKKKQQHSVLILKRAELKQNFYYKVKERDCRVGSDENCQIQVSGDHIQSFHAQVCFRNGFYFLRNISRKSNVFFKLNARVPVIYVSVGCIQGMKVEMGSNIFQFHMNEQKQMEVKVVEGKNENYSFNFKDSQSKISIGRKSTNDISFPQDITLSNLHAKLTNSDKMWYLQDLVTTNGTWIELEDECKIYTGLVFKLGLTNVQLECQIRQVKDQEQQQLTIVYANSQTDLCELCHSNIKNCLFMPCNHCAVCQYCGVNIKNCTVCSQKVTNTAKIFKS